MDDPKVAPGGRAWVGVTDLDVLLIEPAAEEALRSRSVRAGDADLERAVGGNAVEERTGLLEGKAMPFGKALPKGADDAVVELDRLDLCWAPLRAGLAEAEVCDSARRLS